MRQPTQGQVIKKRVWCFVEALLTQAEDSPDFDVDWEIEKGTGNPIFVVNTKRRFLLSLTGLKTTELTEVIASLENLKIWDDRRLKRGKGSQIGHFALKLWSRDAERNREHFEKVWEANRPEKSKALEANQQKSEQFDWQHICKITLEEQKRMTTNRLMNPDQSEMVFDLNQIHVPLALVERKKQDKRNGDDSPGKSHSYKPEYEETQKFEYEEFLAILKSAANNKIAIIGEPGAGKTTLLQRIAFWILENTNDLVIWIPLGNLPTTAPNLKDYLLDNWLRNAILSITPEIKADFDKQLSAGKVWLLLDGVDEMAASGNALSFINNWLPAWSQNLHFVLTCRLNIWEANPYLLNGFQTYRTLEFNQEQVKDFINNCFQQRRGTPALGEQLQQALNQPGKERIKDLVKNPLRLMLLCSIWHSLDGKLPDTKAELYEHFVGEVYRWKKDELKITSQQRKELNAKLKELALAAIDKEENRFSLRQKFVEGVLGECDDKLFQFALRVGWLNRVSVDGKNKPVYAFFHPTFQEYFAALKVKDWRYFLNHVPENPAQGIYRIFEPQWKEVILLWLGREEVGKEYKEELIKALVGFEDGYGDENFYGYRA
jgi:predicted NACHT family NTPase